LGSDFPVVGVSGLLRDRNPVEAQVGDAARDRVETEEPFRRFGIDGRDQIDVLVYFGGPDAHRGGSRDNREPRHLTGERRAEAGTAEAAAAVDHVVALYLSVDRTEERLFGRGGEDGDETD